MTFDPDKALQKARESVHGFYMDGPSEAESTVENLRALLMCMFEQERKLKLERLMWKCKFMQMFYIYESAQDKAGWRGHRWGALAILCEEELEELNK